MRAKVFVFRREKCIKCDMKLKKMAHAVYKTQYHIVRPTRYRRSILVGGVDRYAEILFRSVCEYYPDWEYIAIGIDKDHVHLHMIILPKYAISKVVETIKTNTIRKLKEKFGFFVFRVLGLMMNME